MPTYPTTFWGKLEKHSTNWHSLVGHSADVAACVEALLTKTILNKRLANLAGLQLLSATHIARLSVLAALHDIGKFNIGFQAKADLNARSRWAGHLTPVLDLFGSRTTAERALHESLGLSQIVLWSNDPDNMIRLLIACICHHGKPLPLTYNPDTRLWKEEGCLKPFVGMKNLQCSIRKWFPEAFLDIDDPLPTNSEFHHAFAGVVMFADWLGSTTNFFPFDNGTEQDRMPLARQWAKQIFDEMMLSPTEARNGLDLINRDFKDIFGFPPRPCQDAMISLPIPCTGSVTILEGETGTGKTEAAMARYLHLFKTGVVDGLYFALPTRTAASQIYRRICKTVEQAFPNPESRPPVSLAVPGYIQVDGISGERACLSFEVQWEDDSNEAIRYRGWAAEHPKRYLGGSIVVGTIDQVLLSSLQVKHAHMRASCLLRHLVVVDEVHASDAYMNRLLEDVLNRHILAGGHALLMSATLGAVARTQFSKQFCEASIPTFDEACDLSYPLVTYHQLNEPSQSVEVTAGPTEKQVGVILSNKINAPEDIVNMAIAAAMEGAKVLIIRNTVRDAIQTQMILEQLIPVAKSHLLFRCEQFPTLHHSRFAKADREVLDMSIEKAFGKKRSIGGMIAVATQTVQQSLDLDADLLISDLCPMDILLQRIGRLHRHLERSPDERPTAYSNPQVIVLVPALPDLSDFISPRGPAKGPHGFGTVYSDLRILQATWETLKKKVNIRIPFMNRFLVESATHPSALRTIVQNYGGRWISHENHVVGTLQAQKGLANLNIIDRSAFFGDFQFPDHLDEEKISTRLGEGDRLIPLPTPIESPFQNQIEQLSMPAWMAKGISISAQIQEFSSHAGITQFTWGDKQFIYDRLGLRSFIPTDKNEDDIVDA